MNRLTELDALRGFAALAVVIFHYSGEKNGFNLGCMGVDLFFIISGFVILMTLERCNKPMDFVVGRFSRLYPPYWATIFFIVALMLVMPFISSELYHWQNDLIDYKGRPENFPIKVLVNLSMFQYYFTIRNLDGPFWTLNIELVFYILMFILFVSRQLKNVEKWGFAFLIFSALYSTTLYNQSILYKIRLVLPIINYFPLFYTGILVYKAKKESLTPFRFSGILFSFVIQILLFHNCYRNNNVMTQFEYCLGLTFIYIFIFLFLKQQLNWITNKWTVKLGEISYSLYLIHSFLGVRFLIPVMVLFIGLQKSLAIFFTTLIVIALSYLMQKYIEKPSLKWIKNKYNSTFK